MHSSKFTTFKFIVRDARVFPGIWFDFIYPHNSSLFFATAQIYVAADKSKIYSPVLLWNKHNETRDHLLFSGCCRGVQGVHEKRSKRT